MDVTSFWIPGLFLLAPLVVVPLALHVIAPGGISRAFRAAHALAAASTVAAFLLEPGRRAAALSLPWLAMTVWLAFLGLLRLRSETAIGVGLLLLPVGGGWLVLSRLGATPMGFREPIVLLTAVHFHYAGFVTLTLVGAAARVLGGSRLHRAVTAGAIVGTPLLAAGITLSRTLELLGAIVLSLSLWAFAAETLAWVAPRAAGAARVLLSLSALCLFPSMALALAYAWGRFTGDMSVGLLTLAAVHGPLNAFGFGLCGLLGSALASTQRMAIRQ